mgnify:CR=1 FL=1
MPRIHEFAIWAIKRYRNFNIKSTSRLEGLHAQLKCYLINRLGSLKRLGDAIREWTFHKKNEYLKKLEQQGQKTKSIYKVTEILSLVVLDISWKALDEIWHQYTPVLDVFEEGSDLPSICTGDYRRQWGLPCRHELWRRLESRQRLVLDDISPHWHLRREIPLTEEERKAQTVLDPVVVQRTKQQREEQHQRLLRHGNWPIWGSKRDLKAQGSEARQRQDNSTRREPCHWEDGRRQKRSRSSTEEAPTLTQKKPRKGRRSKMDELSDAMISRFEALENKIAEVGRSQAPQAQPGSTPRETHDGMIHKCL